MARELWSAENPAIDDRDITDMNEKFAGATLANIKIDTRETVYDGSVGVSIFTSKGEISLTSFIEGGGCVEASILHVDGGRRIFGSVTLDSDGMLWKRFRGSSTNGLAIKGFGLSEDGRISVEMASGETLVVKVSGGDASLWID